PRHHSRHHRSRRNDLPLVLPTRYSDKSRSGHDTSSYAVIGHNCLRRRSRSPHDGGHGDEGPRGHNHTKQLLLLGSGTVQSEDPPVTLLTGPDWRVLIGIVGQPPWHGVLPLSI